MSAVSDKQKRKHVTERRNTGIVLGRRKTALERRNLREQAELQLSQMKQNDELVNVLSDFESTKQLVHELQVHQIELEMQNDELRKLQLELEFSRDQYLDLFDFAPVGYMTLSTHGLIKTVNFAAASNLGIERRKLLNSPFSRFLLPESADQWYLSLSTLTQPYEKKSLEVQVKRADGQIRDIQVDVMLMASEEVLTLRMTLLDITTRKQAEQELRIAAHAFETQEGIMITDGKCNIIRVNHAFTEITGYAENEVIGQPASIISSEPNGADCFKNVWTVLSQEHHWQGEMWHKRKQGDTYPVWMIISSVLDDQGEVANCVGCFIDISQQKQVEKNLLDDRKRLEKKVEKSVAEINQMREEGSDVNTALKVMIKLRESESEDVKNLLITELKQEVLPFLNRLKKSSQDSRQVRLLNALDANLQRLISSYGDATTMSSLYKILTPKEIQVASMVREGVATKVIASTLSLSPETISIHRKNIRKKLGLDSKSDNLRSYLISLKK